MRKPRVVITYLEAGMGHIVSAKAISESLKKKYGNKLEICDLYLSKENTVLEKYEKDLVKSVKSTNKNSFVSYFQFFCMDLFGRENTLKLAHGTVFANAKKEMYKVLASYRPDCVITTHFSPNYVALELRDKYFNNMIVATYNPDPNVHGWWDNRCDLFFVNNIQAKKQAININKFLPLNVRQVHPTARECIVKSNRTKEQYRKKYKLPKNNFTIILADGAYATSKLKEYTNEFCKIKKPLTLIVIAGKNEKVKDYFEKKQQKLPENITMKVFGFVDNIQELYCASDVFFTKAGPNAIQDSLFMRTPVVVNFYASPVEEFTNKLYIKQYKCGETILDKVKARKKVEKWIDNPSMLDEYRKNCEILDKTQNGADEIADSIYSSLKYYKPQLFKKDGDEK